MLTISTDHAAPAATLDSIRDELFAGVPWVGLDRLFAVLRDIRSAMPAASWERWRNDEFDHHPLLDLLRQDPMLRRSRDKPRGYAGDAVLLDFIYRIRGPIDGSPLGREIWDHCSSTRPAALGVQARRRILARALDDLLLRPVGSRRVLAVACGHFREGHLSTAVRERALDEILALDSDEQSLGVVQRLFGTAGTRTEHKSVTRLLGKHKLGRFDLAYSAGLYDYLDDNVAQRLTQSLYASLEPGGRLLICNFVPQIYDAGFMEAAMGWQLIYRDEAQLRALADDLPGPPPASIHAWTDPFQAIAYLVVERGA